MAHPRLVEVLPLLASELMELLVRANQPTFAAQVEELRIVDRCRCGDDFCATIYTEPRPFRSGLGTVRCVDPEPSDGLIVLDVCDEQIVGIEVLFRDEIRRELLKVLP